MKRPIALILISIMVLMLSAFSFADVEYSLEIQAPKDEIVVKNWDKPFFITVWVMADLNDELKNLSVTIDEIDGNDGYMEFDREVNYVFGEEGFEYTFKAPKLSAMEEFKITVVAEFTDEEIVDVDDSRTIKVVDQDQDKDEIENDMYPAAPSIANKLLKAAGIPNRVGGVNLIAAVAAEFADADKTDEDFAEEVEEFLVGKLNMIFDVTYDELEEFEVEIEGLEKTNMKSEENKIRVKDNNVEDDDEEEDEDDEEEEEEEEEAAKPEKSKK